jgi:hypothetical protein
MSVEQYCRTITPLRFLIFSALNRVRILFNHARATTWKSKGRAELVRFMLLDWSLVEVFDMLSRIGLQGTSAQRIASVVRCLAKRRCPLGCLRECL